MLEPNDRYCNDAGGGFIFYRRAQIALLRTRLALARQKPLQNYHRGDAIKARILAAAFSAFARKLRRLGARKALVLEFYLAVKIQ